MYEGGFDRMAHLAGRQNTFTSPSFERAALAYRLMRSTGDVEAKIELRSGCAQTRSNGPDGFNRVYLAGPALSGSFCGRTPKTHHTGGGRRSGHSVVRFVRSPSMGARTLCFVNVNELLGF